MGMFDNVRFEMKCPLCGESVNGFQSKDGPCELLDLEPKDVRDFYDSCKCGAHFDFKSEEPNFTNHKLKVTKDRNLVELTLGTGSYYEYILVKKARQ